MEPTDRQWNVMECFSQKKKKGSIASRNPNAYLEKILIKCLCNSCSKPSNASGFKARTPTISSPFTFRSEERAAKRKEARLDPIVLVFYFLLYVMI